MKEKAADKGRVDSVGCATNIPKFGFLLIFRGPDIATGAQLDAVDAVLPVRNRDQQERVGRSRSVTSMQLRDRVQLHDAAQLGRSRQDIRDSVQGAVLVSGYIPLLARRLS